MNYRAHTYRIPNVQLRRANFLSRYAQPRPSVRCPQQRTIYPTPKNPRASNSSHSSERWNTVANIINRIHSLFNSIMKIVNFIKARIDGQTGAYGCSCSCCLCVGVTTVAAATLMVAVSLISVYTPNTSQEGYGEGNLIYIFFC